MTSSTLTSKNQTTIPKAVIDALKLKPSDKIDYHIAPDGRVVLSARTASLGEVEEKLAALRRAAPARTQPASLGEMDQGIRDAVSRSHRKSFS